jgi:hypothetical protein
MPSADRKLELKAKTSVDQTGSQSFVYAKGLNNPLLPPSKSLPAHHTKHHDWVIGRVWTQWADVFSVVCVCGFFFFIYIYIYIYKFSSIPSDICSVAHKVRRKLLPSKFCVVHYSLIVHPFHVIWLEPLGASLSATEIASQRWQLSLHLVHCSTTFVTWPKLFDMRIVCLA